MWMTTALREWTLSGNVFRFSRRAAGSTHDGVTTSESLTGSLESGNTSESRVVLVDESDVERGTAGKKEVHHTGELHRAFSVFLIDEHGRHLMQRRAGHKYHSGGLWSNACCSHPRPGETVRDAAVRRLREELGIEAAVEPAFHMRYRAPMPNGLVEHEYDHVYIGRLAGVVPGTINPDESEVSEVAFMDTQQLRTLIQEDEDRFTRWFLLAWPEVVQTLEADRPGAPHSVFCPDGSVATFLYPAGGVGVRDASMRTSGD